MKGRRMTRVMKWLHKDQSGGFEHSGSLRLLYEVLV